MKKIICLLMAAAVLAGLPAAALAAGDPVTEAYHYTRSSSGDTWDYHIPELTLSGPGAAAVNAAIWEELYYGYVAEAEYSGDDYWPAAMGMDYSWAVNDDTLSLWVRVQGMTDNDSYYVYNVSLTDGERLSDRELLKAAGVSRERFNDLLRSALAAKMDAFPSFEGDDYTGQLREEGLSDGNLALAKPYMGRGGSLCAVAWVYTPAGAGRYLQTLTLIPGDTDAQVASFIERSDSQYLTEADLEGFDAKMCEYARNGVYARAGRGFQSAELQEYFSQFAWYTPSIAPSAFSDSMLNDYQIRNIALVLAYEQAHGYL